MAAKEAATAASRLLKQSSSARYLTPRGERHEWETNLVRGSGKGQG